MDDHNLIIVKLDNVGDVFVRSVFELLTLEATAWEAEVGP